MAEAKLLRATFYILSKQQEKAFDDLEDIIENQSASPLTSDNILSNLNWASHHFVSYCVKVRDVNFLTPSNR